MCGQVADGLDRDVGGQQPEADRNRPLRPPFGGFGHHPRPGEPPDDDDAGQCLDAAAQRPARVAAFPAENVRPFPPGTFPGSMSYPAVRRSLYW